MFTKSIGENIKTYRELKEMSQKELSILSKIHVSQLSRYEKNINRPSLDILIKISQALGVSMLDLFDDQMFNEYAGIIPTEKTTDLIKDNGLNNLFELLKEIDGIEFDLSFLPTDENEEFGFKIKDHKNKFGIGLSLEELRQINKECEQAYKECLKLKIYEMYFKKEFYLSIIDQR